jgi:hypothetical protein
MYNIKEGYKINQRNTHHNDVPYTEEGQKEVYIYAREIADKYNLETIADVGCGSGFKLVKYFDGLVTIGYEVEPALSYLKDRYPDKFWFDSGKPDLSFDNSTKANLIICADVIEHILNPDELLNFLKEFNSQYIVISTPCREVLTTNPKFTSIYKNSADGPPVNPAHVREWTFDEFKLYLSNDFIVVESYLCKNQIECQYHLITPKR